MPNCKQCTTGFEITASDQKFYKDMDVPEPTLCPNCRQQRRLAFRNERVLFKRKCDLCKKSIVSFFGEDAPFPVYCTECWWSDRWDALSYGQDFDFSRPFFGQFHELMMKVPKTGMLHLNNENSEYNSLLAFSKNTYMSPGSYYMEDCFYTRKSQYSKSCLNNNFIDHCELVADSLNSSNCYNAHHLIDCKNCSYSAYMADCIGCKNCFMCSGVSNKTFCYKNKQQSEDEYKKIIGEQMKRDQKLLLKEFLEFNKTIPKKYQNQINCQDASGDYIQNCKNAVECYDCFELEDCKYLTECVKVKDSMDLSLHDKDIELCYELCSGGDRNVDLKFSFCCCVCPDSEYLYSCLNLSDSFGCDSINKRNSHCILNKKYSEEEYGSLKNKIIGHMRKTGEYGEFFPINISLYPYNETLAQDYFPLNKKEAITKGYKWRDENPKNYQPADMKTPSDIDDIESSIVDKILACEKCGKNYRIIRQELDLCRKIGVTPSGLCSDCRYLGLISLKNPRRLFVRACAKCSSSIQTTYSPDRPEKVYCEKCYLKEVY